MSNIDTLISKANKGDAIAQRELGFSCYFGQDIEQDYQTSFRWFLKAAEKNYSEAQYMVDLMYEYGQGMDEESCLFCFVR